MERLWAFHEAFKEVVPLLCSNRNNLTCTLPLQFPGNSRFCENTNDTDYQEVFTQASKPGNKGSRRSVASHLQLTTCQSCGGSAATKAIKLPINDRYTTGDVSWARLGLLADPRQWPPMAAVNLAKFRRESRTGGSSYRQTRPHRGESRKVGENHMQARW